MSSSTFSKVKRFFLIADSCIPGQIEANPEWEIQNCWNIPRQRLAIAGNSVLETGQMLVLLHQKGPTGAKT
jgi:hypothetical protein